MQINIQKFFSFSIFLLFFSLFLTNFIHGMPLIQSISFLSLLPKSIVLIVFAIGIFLILKRINKRMLIFIYICIFIIGLNLMFSDNLIFFRTTMFNFFTNCFPVTLFCMALTRWDYLYRYFLIGSYTVSIMIALAYMTGLLTFGDALYSMGFSYSSILFFLILFDSFINTRKIIPLVFSLPIISVILFHGSRGALTCIMLYIVISLYRLFFFQKKKKESVALFAIFGTLFLLMNNIISLLLDLAWKMGIYSRTLMSLASGTFTSSSGRDVIYNQVINSFLQDPFKIRGINADYALTGIYAHNFLLELLYQFGFFIGIILIFTIFGMIILSMHRKDSSYKTRIILLSLSVWFPYLMISSTIWVTPYFWIFLGIFFNKSKVAYNEDSFINNFGQFGSRRVRNKKNMHFYT